MNKNLEESLAQALSLLQCNLVAQRQKHTPEMITWAQYNVLDILSSCGQATPSLLSTKLGISRQNLSKSLRTLKKLELVHQIKSDDDGRVMITLLTQKGFDFLERAANGRTYIMEQVQLVLTSGEQAILVELCNKINDALEQKH
ncbi:MarR family winged helix-turn-helix transcriptional regulator [Neisseria sp. Ec49-e6-T10]|uniref:MarR family winged helix-turn-helix transcriptional regulator n=1 Tax=Neisseria sp. Ec49-e6-T10 TaxID=3140744 RepID=UPI003EC12399